MERERGGGERKGETLTFPDSLIATGFDEAVDGLWLNFLNQRGLS